MSKQLLRCGTSIGANVAEAQKGQSHADFVAKMCIALKEANETEYSSTIIFVIRLSHRNRVIVRILIGGINAQAKYYLF